MNDDYAGIGGILAGFVAFLVGLALTIVLVFGVIAFANNFGRTQSRDNAGNQVKITHILINRAAQQARINYAQIAATKAEADKRVVEARGIAEAQHIIAGSLTPAYLQYEAIQSQQAIATSGQNNTVIYVPSGVDGVPVQQVQQVPTGK
jgi:regulator of protease activity HflC (stomatin/prohibitin superfamily)